MKCTSCSERIYWSEGKRAKAKGHVYSEAGRREVKITGMCEWCFDLATNPDEQSMRDEEDEADWSESHIEYDIWLDNLKVGSDGE